MRRYPPPLSLRRPIAPSCLNRAHQSPPEPTGAGHRSRGPLLDQLNLEIVSVLFGFNEAQISSCEEESAETRVLYND